MKTINIKFFISGTKINIPFNAICSITNKKFGGDIVIEYKPEKRVVEYVNLEETIKRITRKKLTVEELANKIFKTLELKISLKYLKVLVDVQKSDAHNPVQVWIEKNFE